MMNVVRHTDHDFEAALERIATSSTLFDSAIEQRAKEIIEAVRKQGDAALLELTERFDRAKLRLDQLRVSTREVTKAKRGVPLKVRRAIVHARENISTFSRRSLRKSWTARNREGARVGEKFDPFQRVGIYIPGGAAPLVSTVLMTVTLAKAAGCPEIVVCTPCNSEGKVNPALLAAADQAGATEIYRVGGAQAIAAMALGTATINRVQKIFGPGNAYVVAAKRLLFGYVAIDLLPGPSEVLVLADDTADARFVAADLLAQAEQGSTHERVWLVTPSKRLLQQVEMEIRRQLPKLTREKVIAEVLRKNGWLILVRSLVRGIEVVNRIAPEHCEIMTRDARKCAGRIRTAGALFIGAQTPTVFGDYVAGPSHELPTGGSGVSFSGLTADQFQKRTSVVEYDSAARRKATKVIEALAELEGLGAHLQSARIRSEKT
ncbi:MAG: histidinol dehydrogenase [Verrucomicrobiota bacterium]